MNSTFLEYNGFDCTTTLQCHNSFWQDLVQDFEPAYQLTVDLFEPLIFMQSRGIRVEHAAMEETKRSIVETAAAKQEELNSLCGKELNVNSSKQCQQYFYIELGIPPYYKEGAVTVDDLALQRLARGTAKRPGLKQAKLIQEIRGLQKLHGTYLDIEFDADSRLRCSYNPRGTKFGRLSSSKTVFGTGCVTGDAEVLTRLGWVRIDSWQTRHSIAQYNPTTDSIEFVQATLHEQDSPGILITCKGEQVHQALTPDHRVLYRPKLTGAFREARAFDLLARGMTVMPLSGHFHGGIYTPSAPKLLVAALADGSFEWNRVRIAFKKERKINRFLELCKEYSIQVDEQAARPGYRRFAFNRPYDWPETKAWGSWILNLTSTASAEILSELGHWDGIIRGESQIFYTADESQASWIATLSHIHGMSATVASQEQSVGSWSDTLMWRVNIKPRNYAYTEGKHWGVEKHEGKVYCPTVPSTYWLMRYQGKIAITGNTNQQNLPQEFKRFLVADPGYVFWEVDKRQAEWVVVAYLTQDANMLSVVESGRDTHIHTASLMFGLEAELVEYENKLVGQNSDPDLISALRLDDALLARFAPQMPRTMSCRQCGKKSNHGLNYDETWTMFALINEIEPAEAKRIINLYHSIYPGIRVWYEWVKRQLQKDRMLTNCFGRKVRFMDQWGPDLWKSAYSMLPQSTVVDSLNTGLVKIYKSDWLCKELNIDLLAQVHDSILLQVPVEVALDPAFNEVCALVYDYCSPELNYNGRGFKIATDSKIGLNWEGFHKERNPIGMRECKTVADMQKAVGEICGPTTQ